MRCFDRRQVLGRERARVGEVVVEAVLDHRTDGDLRLGKQLLHRLRQQVRGGVADDLQALRVVVGDDGELRVALDEERGVDQLAVDRPASAALAQARANAGRDLVHGDGAIEGSLAAVGQRDDGH